MGIFLPFGDHLNAEREGKRRKPCRIWADGGSATIRSKSVWKIRLERMAGNPATCGYSDGIPFAHFLSTKKPLTFPASGHPRGGGVHFSIEWALGEMVLLIFPTDGPRRGGEARWRREREDRPSAALPRRRKWEQPRAPARSASRKSPTMQRAARTAPPSSKDTPTHRSSALNASRASCLRRYGLIRFKARPASIGGTRNHRPRAAIRRSPKLPATVLSP